MDHISTTTKHAVDGPATLRYLDADMLFVTNGGPMQVSPAGRRKVF